MQPLVYTMFYTGVNHDWAQAIGVAISNDLYNWSKSPSNAVYTPSTTWAAWAESPWSNCRDPFVFQEGGVWHLLTTASTQNSEGAIAHATSSNLRDWTDQGPLVVHNALQRWHVLESVQLHHVDDKYYLFFTEQDAPSASYLQAPDLAGPWDIMSSEYFDSGRAVEIIEIGPSWYVSRHAAVTYLGQPFYTIKIDHLQWGPVSPPTVVSGPAIAAAPPLCAELQIVEFVPIRETRLAQLQHQRVVLRHCTAGRVPLQPSEQALPRFVSEEDSHRFRILPARCRIQLHVHEAQIRRQPETVEDTTHQEVLGLLSATMSACGSWSIE